MIKLKHILSEQAISINGLFRNKKDIGNKRQKAWDTYVSLMQKSRGVEMKFRYMEEDLIRQRDQVMSEMENDEDVLQNVNVGHKGAVAKFGKDLDKIDRKLEAIREKKKSFEETLADAKKEASSWASRENAIIKAIKNALKIR